MSEPEMAINPVVVCGGGLTLLTSDPVVRRVVARCAELERQNVALRYELTARYRTLRRDISQIKRMLKDERNG